MLEVCYIERGLYYHVISIGFFMNLDLSQVDCVSSEGERRQKLAFEKLKSTLIVEPSARSWLIQKRIQSTCPIAQLMAFIFSTFSPALL